MLPADKLGQYVVTLIFATCFGATFGKRRKLKLKLMSGAEQFYK